MSMRACWQFVRIYCAWPTFILLTADWPISLSLDVGFSSPACTEDLDTIHTPSFENNFILLLVSLLLFSGCVSNPVHESESKFKNKEIFIVRTVLLECVRGNVEYSGEGSINLARFLGPSNPKIVISNPA
jgi:hypothetical protein